MKYFFTTLVLLFHFSLLAQEIDGSFNPSENLVPRSPEALSLLQFQKFAPNPYTGSAGFSIRIASLAENDLNVNVALRYHASSIPVNQVVSSCGANWNVSGGGSLTRRMRGLPDDADLGIGFLEFRSMYQYEDGDSDPDNSVLDWINNENTTRMELLASGCYDSQPDEYVLEVGGYSARFAFSWNGTEPIIASNADLKISYQQETGSNRIVEWTVTTPDGVMYTFGELERTKILSTFSFSSVCSSGVQEYVSTWHLSRIQSPNIVGQYVDFIYESYELHYDWQWFETQTFKISNHPDCGALQSGSTQPASSTIIFGKRLQQIQPALGRFQVIFHYNTPRTDDEDLAITINFNRLDQIEIKGATGTLLHRWELDYLPQGRLLLEKVQQFGNDGSSIPPYMLTYHSGSIPSLRSKNIDHWGYANGSSNHTLLPSYIHEFDGGTFVHFPGGNREPRFNDAQSALLKSITQPTGAIIEIGYENHDYSFISNATLESQEQYEVFTRGEFLSAESLVGSTDWVEEVGDYFSINESNSTNVWVTVFVTGGTYAPFGGLSTLPQAWLEDSDGNSVASFILDVAEDDQVGNLKQYKEKILILLPGQYRFRAKARTWGGAPDLDRIAINAYWDEIDLAAPILEKLAGGVRIKDISIKEADGTELSYRQFRYEMDDGTGFSSGVIFKEPKYAYNSTNLVGNQFGAVFECDFVQLVGGSRYILASTSGSHIGYRRVEETIGRNGEGGKIIHEFNSPFDYPDALNLEKPFGPPISNQHKTGLQSKRTLIDKDGNTVQWVQNHYQFPQTDVSSAKIGLGKLAPPPYAGSYQHLLSFGSLYYSKPFTERFSWSLFPLRLGYNLSDYTTTWLDGVTQTVDLDYHPQLSHRNPISSTTTNSDGKVHRTETDYALEQSTASLATEAAAGVQEMLSRNMVAIPLEIRKYVDGVFQGGQRTEYELFQNGDLVKPRRYIQLLHTGDTLHRGHITNYTPRLLPHCQHSKGLSQTALPLGQWTIGQHPLL